MTSIPRTAKELKNYSTNLKIFSKEDIYNLRKKYKLTQQEFGDCINVSKNEIYYWEKGIRNPNGPATKLLNIIDQKGLDFIL